jgi:hypothetical protein
MQEGDVVLLLDGAHGLLNALVQILGRLQLQMNVRLQVETHTHSSCRFAELLDLECANGG